MKGSSTRVNVGLALAGAVVLMSPDVAYACEKCFGAAADSPVVQGVSMAMLSLIVMTGVIWGGIGMFFVNMRKRTRMLELGDWIVTEYGEIREAPPEGPDAAHS